jgi:hypothetical protein
MMMVVMLHWETLMLMEAEEAHPFFRELIRRLDYVAQVHFWS